MNHRFLIPLLFIASCVIGSASADNGTFQVDGAWIAEAPPVSKVMVAYLTITNTGTDSVDIVHAESNLYSSIEFHESVHDGGMARMVQHEILAVPANGKLELKQGGLHLMLFNPNKRLQAGDVVDIKLTTKNNKTEIISVPVRRAQY